MTYTDENLKKAFAGESQANRKYLAFATKADKEGYPQIAKLFKAAAEGETIHALNYLSKMGGIGTTAENLEAAISGETEEFNDMYPSMVSHAKEEERDDVATSFSWALTVEKEHAEAYKEALDKMKDLPVTDYYVCQGCGHLAVSEAPDKCPVCGAPKSSFKKVN
ncbi:MAG: rubrerythrin family protein [Patescibacteria group bacterium]|nr:rubrerythrin family protein [Patescibacteria group bacterium]